MVYFLSFFSAICTKYIVELRLPNFMLFLHIMIYAESVLSEGHQLIYNLLISLLLAKIKENAGVLFEQIRSKTGSELFSYFFLPCSLFVSHGSFALNGHTLGFHDPRSQKVEPIFTA